MKTIWTDTNELLEISMYVLLVNDAERGIDKTNWNSYWYYYIEFMLIRLEKIWTCLPPDMG